MNCSHAGLRTVYGFFARGSFYEIGATVVFSSVLSVYILVLQLDK